MGIPAIVHLLGEDAIFGELDAAPDPTHNFLVLRNVTKKDGKPLAYLMEGVEIILFAWHKITFVEIMDDIKLVQGAAATAPATVPAGAAAGQQAPAGTTVLYNFREEN
jgi:hypothetical protein